MPYTEISNKTNIPLRTVNQIIATIYPKTDRPQPWKDAGMRKEDFYEQYKNTHS